MLKMFMKMVPVLGAGIYFSLLFSSCTKNNPDSSGVEYMPDMYRSPSYEDNSVNPNFADSMTDRRPVTGTVPVGFWPDPFPNTPDGWTAARQYLKDPYPATAEVQDQGKAIYGIYCVHCHGKEGEGDGPVGKKLPGPPPPYSGPQLKSYTEGEIYQVLEYGGAYGNNLMGSHASQLTVDERWKLIRYIQVLQHHGDNDNAGGNATSASAAAAK
ncbi:MAG: cytochrome c [Bacteroidia bacterium]|nr:cytochrome c [Bacteroidia bacterium]